MIRSSEEVRTEASSPSQKSNGSWVFWLLGGGSKKQHDALQTETETFNSSSDNWSDGPPITLEHRNNSLKAVLYKYRIWTLEALLDTGGVYG